MLGVALVVASAIEASIAGVAFVRVPRFEDGSDYGLPPQGWQSLRFI
jgi:hypothetical protein